MSNSIAAQLKHLFKYIGDDWQEFPPDRSEQTQSADCQNRAAADRAIQELTNAAESSFRKPAFEPMAREKAALADQTADRVCLPAKSIDEEQKEQRAKKIKQLELQGAKSGALMIPSEPEMCPAQKELDIAPRSDDFLSDAIHIHNPLKAAEEDQLLFGEGQEGLFFGSD